MTTNGPFIDINPLAGAAAGGHVEVDFSLPAGDDIPEARTPSAIAARVYPSDDEVVVAGTIKLIVSEECRLCLEPLLRELELDLSGRFVPVGRADLDPNAARYDPDAGGIAEDGRIDLSDLITQTVIVALNPFADCQGTCSRYGQVKSDFPAKVDPADAIDPRLAPLKDMWAEMIADSKPPEDV